MSKHIQIGQQRGGSPIVFKSGDPVSVICVASTFTSLSYANNGGKVRITSTGVHGLTTSPAVGAKVYVSWSGGTGVSGLYTVLSVDSTTAITVDATYVAGLGTPTVAVSSTEIIIDKISLPTLTNNSWIDVTAAAGFVASSSAKQIRFLFNTISITNIGVTSTATHNSLRNDGFFSLRGSLSAPFKVVANGSAPGSASSGVNNEGTTGFLSGNIIGVTLKITTHNEAIKLEAWKVVVYL